MTSEEKKTVAIAAGLGVAALLVLWFVRGNQDVTVDGTIASPDTTAVAGTSDVGNSPGYINYNIPAFNPGGLPNIVSNTNVSTNFGAGCCPGCSGDNDMANNVGEFQALSGLGNYAGVGPLASGLG